MSIGGKFVEQFDPTRGDLVYGRSDFRGQYLEDAKKKFGGAWMIVDDYNNASILAASGLFKGDGIKARQAAYNTANSYSGSDVSTHFYDVKGYLDRLYSDPKYNPSRSIHAPEEKKASEHARDEDEAVQWLIIRRACKFGLEWVVEHTAMARIHFVIDGLDMKGITQKEKIKTGNRRDAAVPITTSELCSIYRRWGKKVFQNRINFYEGKLEVAAPWDNASSRDLWEGYGRTRFQRKLQSFRSKLESRLFSPHDTEWERKVKDRMTDLEKTLTPALTRKEYYTAVDLLTEAEGRLPAPKWRKA